jgi:hypothetical protein
MNKIIIGLFAIASLSTAALASDRTDIDPRDRAQVNGVSIATNDSAPLYVVSGSAEEMGLSSFERVQAQSAENENSGH